ncbi:MAG: type VI secretion system baseplate subunit TssE [Gammaproteobacteria bacterium]|nr:type VI secretion system baseplate subunit TssE [Gammaproteobacteria bacterium]
MTRLSSTRPLVPSIFDRLIDQNPGVAESSDLSRSQLLRELRESVRRDLENLLNTRIPCHEFSEEMDQLTYSVINYGIPDFFGNNLVSAREKERFRKQLEKVISFFEPRFKSVRVELVEGSDEYDRTLRFRIDALLHVQPAVKPIVFDSSMEPVTHNIRVRDLESD